MLSSETEKQWKAQITKRQEVNDKSSVEILTLGTKDAKDSNQGLNERKEKRKGEGNEKKNTETEKR